MEHLLFHLVVQGIQALDHRLQKPLSSVIPELGRLRSDPNGYLQQAPVTIGPRKRQVLALVIGLVFGLASVAILLLIFAKMHRLQRPDPLSRATGIIITFLAIAFVARSVAMYVLRGGTMTLRPEGIEIIQDAASLFMPWDLFFAAGAVFQADQKNVVLPINPAVPIGVSGNDDEVLAMLPEHLESPLAECDEEGQMVLKDLYEVRLTELGFLLNELGQRLGSARGGAAGPPAAVPPLVVPDDKGWLRINLTQLPFPPVCAGCSEPTAEVLEMGVSAHRRSMKLPLPCCQVCQLRRDKIRTFSLLGGLLLGVLAGVAIAIVLAPAIRDSLITLLIGATVAAAIGIPLAALGHAVGREMATPVACTEYKPEKGTLKMRFRDPQRSAGLMAVMGLPLKHNSKR